MSDGEGFHWRLHGLLKLPGPPPPRSRDSLPVAPQGMKWIQSDGEKQEWRLVKAEVNEPELVNEEKHSFQASVIPDSKVAQSSNSLPPRSVVDRFPVHSDTGEKEEDWELLSDNISSNSNQTPRVFIHHSRSPHNGSVRSLTSMEGAGNIFQESSLNTNTLTLPFKIQRTASSSTIDSSDNALGPLGKGVLGVDYVEHVVLPTDTLQGICLTYKISSTRLRQANCFSGNSLLLAPNKLVIPLSKKALRSGFIRVQDTDAKEYKLHAMLAEFPDLSMNEAKAYLELADWVLKDAIRSAKDDGEWEREMDNIPLRAGEIRITPKLNKGIPIGFSTIGAGIQPKAADKPKSDVTPHNPLPAISTKTVNAQDMYAAVHQHNNFGVELQALGSEKSGMKQQRDSDV